MATEQVIVTLFFLVGIVSSFTAIGLTFFTGRTRIKEIDRAVYGYEFPHDSIFALLIRVPTYAGAFIWKWSAKRAGLTGKIEHFDTKFRWPFIATFFLFLLSILSFIAGVLFEKYSGLM